MEKNLTIKIRTGLKENLPTAGKTLGEMKFTTDTKELFIGDDTSNVRISASIIETTYAALKALRDAGGLTPGQQYRITDYVTTTTQANTQSAGHQFDLIVIADSTNKLNEQARAIQHEGDTYFANSKLEAWQLKYCLDNDTNRFAWADMVNGKGVIYRMIDEFNNDCPYDFKNIQFIRKITDGVLDLDNGVDTFVYTFTMSDLISDKVVDISLKQNTEYEDDDGQYKQYANNVIKEALVDYQLEGVIKVKLNDNVFLNIFDGLEDYLYFDCHSNTLGSNCWNNTFGNSCTHNTLGNDCRNNAFGEGCSSNTFGKSCNSNTLGNSCSSNTFGERCNSNTFVKGCDSNTFGEGCNSNTLSNSCGYNTFGTTCRYNTLGTTCRYNTFGNDCGYNTFGERCNSNNFGKGCYYLKISENAGEKKYLSIDNGLSGASSANQLELYDSALAVKSYQISFKKASSGRYLMLWATDTGVMTGKYKATSTTATWADIV